MATLSKLVSLFRGKYKTMSDDTKFPDRLIISAFDVSRAKLAYDWSQKQKGLSRQFYYGFCMPLCIGKPLKCPCIAEAQCHALVSKYNLPKTVSLAGNTPSIFIRDGSGKMLTMMTPQEASSMNLNPAYKNKPSYWIENYRGQRYLVIWNVLNLDVIYVDLVPDNLDSISEIPLCDSTGASTSNCGDWKLEEYPIDSNLEYNLFLMAEQLLLGNAKVGDDTLNESVDKITE